MKIIYTLAALLTAASLFAGPETEYPRKNMTDAEFRTLPGNYAPLLTNEADKWDFNFRPYDASEAKMLWTDPNVIRKVASGEFKDKEEPTGVRVLCDENGFTVLIYCAVNDYKGSIAKGGQSAAPGVEMFFLPGDSDNEKIEHYYQFFPNAEAPYLDGIYPWLKEDRSFRSVEQYLVIDSQPAASGFILRVSVPWEALFDRLPFSDKKDNFWRLSVIRWTAAGGRTWGGKVHAQNSAGLIRWPEFTQEQKTSIMKATLIKGWRNYNNLKNKWGIRSDVAPVVINFERKAMSALPHTWANVNQDYEFREKWLEPKFKEMSEMGKMIADFEKLSPEEQVKFYNTASQKLFNFYYDLEDAYADFIKAKLFQR